MARMSSLQLAKCALVTLFLAFARQYVKKSFVWLQNAWGYDPQNDAAAIRKFLPFPGMIFFRSLANMVFYLRVHCFILKCIPGNFLLYASYREKMF